jgi:phosphate starvation-inducible protein PhoH and related proteins
MIEKTIFLEGIDPVDVYGANNSGYETIRKFFPKIKIVARGHEVRVMGEKTEVSRFEQKLENLIAYFHKFNHLNEREIESLLQDETGEIVGKPEDLGDVLLYGNTGKPVKARTVNQKKLVKEYLENDLLFAIGPAGTGKTYTAIALAVMAFKNKEVKKIILTRPAVEAGEHLGFLPGDMKDKLDPYLQPLYDALHDMIPPKKLEGLIEDGTVQIAPLAYMRGRTLDHAFVILDEAQNATSSQLKMFLTRMGRSAKFIVTGDITQVDLPNKRASGLVPALNILKNIEGISIVYFDNRDIIRHKLVKYIVEAYEKQEE